LWDAYRQVHSRTTKIIANEWLVVEIRAEQVSASEDAKNDQFLTSANFCANGNNFGFPLEDKLSCAASDQSYEFQLLTAS